MERNQLVEVMLHNIKNIQLYPIEIPSEKHRVPGIILTDVTMDTHMEMGIYKKKNKKKGTSKKHHVVTFKEDLLNVCPQIAFKGTDVGDPSGASLEDACYQVAVSTSTPYDRQVAARVNYNSNCKTDDPARRAEE